MTAQAAEPETDVETAPRGGFRPRHLAIGLGVAFAVFTVISGVLPLITEWENDDPVHREVFVNIPGPLKVAFYTVIPVLIVWGAFRFADRMKNWERGKAAPTRRTTAKNAKRRFADYRAGVYMKTLLRDPAAGLMHSMIYFGFLVLLGVTTVLEVDHQLPEGLKFLQGHTYSAYALIGDAAGAVFLGGVHLGAVPAVRPTALPHPDQVEARARRHPRHVLRHRRLRLRRRDVPHRAALGRG